LVLVEVVDQRQVEQSSIRRVMQVLKVAVSVQAHPLVELDSVAAIILDPLVATVGTEVMLVPLVVMGRYTSHIHNFLVIYYD
jgi:uracil phosphoribosyltransferase